MLSITPCRDQISDRFPIASFNIEVPPSRYYEVACATDPRLFHSEWQRHRSPSNFFTSRGGGLVRASTGPTAWFLPPDQLRRFAGSRRVYYALASYGNPSGGQPQFSIAPDALDRVPSISIAPDFTGRGLDRSRLFGVAPAPDAYGAPESTSLRWGGDDALDAENTPEESSDEYDDGHSPELWSDSSTPAEEEMDREAAPASASALEDQAAYDDGIAAENRDHDDQWWSYPTAVEDEEISAGDEPVEDAPDQNVTEQVEEPASAYGWAYGDGDDGEDVPGESALDDDEPGGYEDAAALYGAVGFASDDGGVAVMEPETVAPAADGDIGAGRAIEYREDDDEEELLPAGSASAALGIVALDIPEKVRLIRVIAGAESGRDGYAAINPDNEYSDPAHPAFHRYHIGLSWGLIQFTQRSGALGRVLKAAKAREEKIGASLPESQRFANLFGPDWEALLRVTNEDDANARVGPVGGAMLWEPVWTARFRAAGGVPYVTYAQNEVAITDYFDPNLRFASWLGLDTSRALAMVIDRCIHMGNGGGRSWIMRAVGPVQTQADRDAALRALGHADLRAFQSTYAPHLAADGRWGALTHAAMTAALRAIGERSPLPVHDGATMLRRIVDAAKGARFQARVKRLFDDRTDLSDSVSYTLV